jgi:glycosyltransferase involved in cell wall biosynthesis
VPVRIVILGPTYPFRGGIAHYTTLLAEHLRARHEVALLSFVSQYPRRLFPGRTDRDPSAAAVTSEAERVLSPLLPWTWWRTARRAAALQPDIVLVQWWVPFWAPSLATVVRLVRWWSDARIVFVCHNVLPHQGGGALTTALTRLALRRGDAFIVHSRHDAEALRRLLTSPASGDPRVIRTALPVFSIGAPMGRAGARRRLGLPADARVALFFGFVRPYKGLGYLIDALPRVLRDVPAAHLLVAGEFWQPADEYGRRAAELGVGERVRLDDRYIPNEEVGLYFAAADVVVLPYVEATQSAVVSLAAQFGRPVIATETGGLPESVVDGETGLIVPPADSAALAAALVRVFTEPTLAERLGAGVRGSAERFSWRRLEEQLAGLAAEPEPEPGGKPGG